jgi:glutathione S-transferase
MQNANKFDIFKSNGHSNNYFINHQPKYFMYKLYYSSGACSLAVHALLNELNVSFSLENLSGGKSRSPEFLKINPLGQVPVLELEDGHILREGAAILIYLATKHRSPLLPESKKEYQAALEALMFCNATLHPAYGRGFFVNKVIDDQKVKEVMIPAIVKSINNLWQEVEHRLSETEFLAGHKLTLADILLTVIANWSNAFPGIKIGDKAKHLFKKVSSMPSFQKALLEENVEYKALS